MDNADSARMILDEIRVNAVRPKSEQARFHLVDGLIRYRLNIYPTSDSLISLVVDHYADRRTDPLRLAQARYLRADIRNHLGDYSGAMADALPAYDIARNSLQDNYLWRAKTAEQVADVFINTQSVRESLPYQNQAIELYRKAGKADNVNFALCDKAQSLGLIGKRDDAIDLLDSISAIARTAQAHGRLLPYALKYLYVLHFENGNDEKALEILDELNNFDFNNDETAVQHSIRACILTKQGKLSEAKRYLDLALDLAHSNYSKAVLFKSMSSLCKAKRDYSEMQANIDSMVSTISSEVTESLNQSALSAQRDYLNQKATDEQRQKERILYLSLIAAALLGIVIAVLISRHVIESKHHKEEIIAKMDEIRTLTGQLSTATTSGQTRSSILSKEIENLFKDQWTTLNLICSPYFEGPDDPIVKSNTLQEFEKYLQKLTSPQNISRIEESVNRYMDNFLVKLRTECPSLKKSDITVITLILAGMTPKTICLFIGTKLNSFYTKRSRIIERIKKQNPPHLELFLSKLT